jgi:DNA-binding response OmpR family regulator
MKTILIVEDEVVISQVLKAYLRKAGYDVVEAFDGNEAIAVFHLYKPSLILLDVMLPGRNGWSVLKEVREKSSCPIIMLTALGEIDDRLSGFHSGADDYISKPFIADEVIARVQAILRRSPLLDDQNSMIKQFGTLKINRESHSVWLNGAELSLTPRDLSLFMFLSDHPNLTFTRDQLIDHVWGIDYDGSDRAVDLSIKRIRKHLHHWSVNEGEIKTLRGLGYQFCVYE